MSESITWVRPNRSRATICPEDQYISVGWAKSKNVPNPQITINIFEPAMKDLRWLVGDRLDVGFDESFIYLRRSSSGAYKLTSATAVKNSQMIGTSTSARIAFTRPTGFPFDKCPRTHFPKTEVAISQDGLVSFIYPQGEK